VRRLGAASSCGRTVEPVIGIVEEVQDFRLLVSICIPSPAAHCLPMAHTMRRKVQAQFGYRFTPIGCEALVVPQPGEDRVRQPLGTVPIDIVGGAFRDQDLCRAYAGG